MSTTMKLTPEQITAILDGHSGSLERYHHHTRRFIYTPGVHDLAELCSAYWLLDVIASYGRHPKLVGEEFLVWKLAVHANRTATVTADDGNEHVLLRQHIHHTDFPLAEISLYLTDGVLLLPGEY